MLKLSKQLRLPWKLGWHQVQCNIDWSESYLWNRTSSMIVIWPFVFPKAQPLSHCLSAKTCLHKDILCIKPNFSTIVMQKTCKCMSHQKLVKKANFISYYLSDCLSERKRVLNVPKFLQLNENKSKNNYVGPSNVCPIFTRTFCLPVWNCQSIRKRPWWNIWHWSFICEITSYKGHSIIVLSLFHIWEKI